MVKKKRCLTVVLAILLAFTMLATFTKPAPAAPPEAEPWPDTIIGGYVTAGGSDYARVVGLTKLYGRYLSRKITVTPVLAGGSGSKVVLFAKGELDFSSIGGDAAYKAMRGLKPYQKADIRGAAAFGVNTWHIITQANSGIKSLADAKGKRVMCLQPTSPLGTGGARALFECYGVTEENTTFQKFSQLSECYQALKDGTTDLLVRIIGIKEAGAVELFRTKDMVLLPITKKDAQCVNEKVGYTLPDPGVIPANSYRGQDKEVLNLEAPRVFVVNSKLPESLVYEMCKALYDHLDEWRQFHPVCAQQKLETAADHVTVVPYHSGAIKYLKEKGIWTAKHDAIQAKMLSELGLKK